MGANRPVPQGRPGHLHPPTTRHGTPCQDARTLNYPALAYRHLVKDRLDITGARWGVSGAEAVLKLRANGDFDAYWKWNEQQEFTRNHQARYREGLILAA